MHGYILIYGREAVQRLQSVQTVIVERNPVLHRRNRKYCAGANRKKQPGAGLQLADPKQTLAMNGARKRMCLQIT